MAIFNMEDSSIGEYINEHGGAHRRIINNLKKEKDNLDDKHKKIDNAAISEKRKSELKSKLHKKDEDLDEKTHKLLGYAVKSRDIGTYVNYANKHDYNLNSDYGKIRGAKNI